MRECRASWLVLASFAFRLPKRKQQHCEAIYEQIQPNNSARAASLSHQALSHQSLRQVSVVLDCGRSWIDPKYTTLSIDDDDDDDEQHQTEHQNRGRAKRKACSTTKERKHPEPGKRYSSS